MLDWLIDREITMDLQKEHLGKGNDFPFHCRIKKSCKKYATKIRRTRAEVALRNQMAKEE